MQLDTTLERTQSPGLWRQIDPDADPSTRLAGRQDWPRPAQQALQLGLRTLHDRLAGAGADRARVNLEVHAEDDRAEVRVALESGDGLVVRNGSDAKLHQAVRDALRAVTRAVDDGALGELEEGTRQAPWEQLSDAVHRYARHAVARAERRLDVVAGRIDPRDLAERALVARVEKQQPVELATDLPSLRAQVDGLLAQHLERESGRTTDEQLQAFVGRLADPSERPADSAALRREDTIGAAPRVPMEVAADQERNRLVRALFELEPDQRYLFAETAVDGFRLESVAAARHLGESEAALTLNRAVDTLSRSLDRNPREILRDYTELGKVLRRERRALMRAR